MRTRSEYEHIVGRLSQMTELVRGWDTRRIADYTEVDLGAFYEHLDITPEQGTFVRLLGGRDECDKNSWTMAIDFPYPIPETSHEIHPPDILTNNPVVEIPDDLIEALIKEWES